VLHYKERRKKAKKVRFGRSEERGGNRKFKRKKTQKDNSRTGDPAGGSNVTGNKESGRFRGKKPAKKKGKNRK